MHIVIMTCQLGFRNKPRRNLNEYSDLFMQENQIGRKISTILSKPWYVHSSRLSDLKCVCKLGYHWLRQWLVAWLMPSQYLKLDSWPLVTYCELDTWEHTSITIWIEMEQFSFKKMNSKPSSAKYICSVVSGKSISKHPIAILHYKLPIIIIWI